LFQRVNRKKPAKSKTPQKKKKTPVKYSKNSPITMLVESVNRSKTALGVHKKTAVDQ